MSTSHLPPAPATVWRALAARLAARQSMRVWRGHNRGYDQVRRLATVNLPSLPAALPVFNRAGWTNTLALDFDTKLGSTQQLAHDIDDAIGLITKVGGRVIVDRSPAGGHHVWLPLWTEHRLETLMPVLQAMRARWPTLDITPMTNPATGCLTGPGSPCIGGGHRELLTPLDVALDVVEHRCQPGTLGALHRALIPRRPEALASSIAPGAEAVNAPTPHGPGEQTQAVHRSRRAPADALGPALHAFATTGEVPAQKVGWSRSEARMAVLVQSVRAGLSADEVSDCITSGTWRGMAAAFDKYGSRWTTRFHKEWNKAERLVTSPGSKLQLPEHKQRFTGGIAWQREWLAQALHWLSHQPVPKLSTSTVSAVLQALSYIGWLRNSRMVSPGGRWLSIAAGMLTEATVWLTLRSLAGMDGAPIRLAVRHRGPHADTYELVTPRIHDQPIVVSTNEALQVTVGRVPAVWRTIGHCARETFELIEKMPMATDMIGRVRKSDIKRLAATSSSAVDLALARLTAFGLIETGRGWVRRTATTLADLARDHGVQSRVDQRLDRHRAQRRTWWMLLELWTAALAVDCPDVEQLPADPLGPTEREDWLCAVMATGPPHDPYEPTPRDRRLADTITRFRAILGAVTLGTDTVDNAAGRHHGHRATVASSCDHPVVTFTQDGGRN